MSLLDAQTLTLTETNSLTVEGVNDLCLNEGYNGLVSSKRLFKNRLFASRLFAPALFRGVGEEADVPTGIPALTKSIYSGIGLARVLNPGPAAATSIYSGIGLAKVRNV
jgi:hypothetical protein